MPPKVQKETPLTPQLTDRLNDLTARHQSTDESEAPTSVDEWKALGNACFSNGSQLTAIRCYTKAIVDLAEAGGDTAVLRSNRSAAYLKSSMFSGPALALKDAEAAVAYEPNWFKGYLRVADAQFARKKYDEAAEAYEHALRLDPSCQAARASLKELRKEMFLRDLEVQEKEKRKAEEEEMDRLKETGEYDEVLHMGHGWSSANVNSTLNTTYAGPSATAEEKESEKEEKPPLEFHNAPIRFHHESLYDDDEHGVVLEGLGWANLPRQPQDNDPRHGNRRPPRSRGVPTVDETEELVRTWKRDLIPREEDVEENEATALVENTDPDARRRLVRSGAGRAGSGPSSPTPASATAIAVTTTAGSSGSAGLAYKERLMGQFRSKLATDTALGESIEARKEEDLRKGESVNYREGDRYRKMYEKSTNGIGLGISADAYKDYVGTDRTRW